MKDMIRLCVSLGVVCLVGATALVYVNAKTLGPRQLAQQTTLTKSLKLVLPAASSTTKPVELSGLDDVRFFLASDAAGQPLAVAGQGSTRSGFGGEVVVLVGLERDGRIRGVMVTKHSETPGLGTKATDRKQLKSLWAVLAGKADEVAFPANAYLDAYSGKPAGQFVLNGGAVEQRIDGVSGATISSKAILAAVNRICEGYAQHQDAIWSAK